MSLNIERGEVHQGGSYPKQMGSRLSEKSAWPFPTGEYPSGQELEVDEVDEIDSFQISVAETALANDPTIQNEEPTTRKALIEARIGQGGYRRRMLALWEERCAVTGCGVRLALIASHAKPWSEATNAQRLDEYNGLLLTASIDRLFDQGLVSFDDDGQLLCKPRLNNDDLARLGLSRDARLRKIDPRHLPYLAAHRARHGF